MGPILQAFTRRKDINSLVCLTGQHPTLLKEPLELFGISAQFDLALKQRGPHPDNLVAALLPALGDIVEKTKPDWIIAVGDTTSAMCASLIAMYRRVRFAHVEAGLRTGSTAEPFPEEFHRRVCAIAADLHFAPNPAARANLLHEGIAEKTISLTGNPIIDALRFASDKPDSKRLANLLSELKVADSSVGAGRKLVVVTFHRRENIGRPAEDICSALRTLATKFEDELAILCLVHPNPRISRPARHLLGATANITLSPPVDYATLLALLKRTTLLLTDSGGLQEEAPYLHVPTLVLRNVTERPEGVAAGVVRLVGTDPGKIVDESSRLLENAAARRAMIDEDFSAYGDGNAARRIVDALIQFPKKNHRTGIPKVSSGALEVNRTSGFCGRGALTPLSSDFAAHASRREGTPPTTNLNEGKAEELNPQKTHHPAPTRDAREERELLEPAVN